MIVTTGKSIRVEAGYQNTMHFERTGERPGVVRVTLNQTSVGQGVITFDLPANTQESAEFINAYRRCIEEDVGYRERKNEFLVRE